MESHTEKKKNHNSKILIIILCAFLAVAIGIIIWLLRSGKAPAASETDGGSKQAGLVVPERQEMIRVTAYESLELKADTLQQDVHLSTISDNECITVMSLMLEDGTELWQSAELYPGQPEGVFSADAFGGHPHRYAQNRHRLCGGKLLREERTVRRPVNGRSQPCASLDGAAAPERGRAAHEPFYRQKEKVLLRMTCQRKKGGE